MDEPTRPITNPQPPRGIQSLPEKPLTGTSVAAAGVTGESNGSYGVYGQSLGPVGTTLANQVTADGVYGVGKNGVHGLASTGHTNTQGLGDSGVLGQNLNGGEDGGNGVSGVSTVGHGVYGQTSGNGVSDSQTLSNYSGVSGIHLSNGPGVLGFATGTGPGVLAVSGKGYGIFAEGITGAAHFAGAVLVDGSVTVSQDVILAGADCAEQFDSADEKDLEPGTVVVIGATGALCESNRPYDKRVAGVVSGAGPYRPALVMDGSAEPIGRAIIAMVGKVYCKVDADCEPIEVGDLLTASPTPGHAMRASDPSKAFGSVIGKALRPLRAGRGLIPVLVALQ
jgi:hypothetical protein